MVVVEEVVVPAVSVVVAASTMTSSGNVGVKQEREGRI